MDKYEVIAEARAYMKKFLYAANSIRERQRSIEDTESILRLDPAAAIVNYNKTGGSHTGERGSVVENLQIRREEMLAKIKRLQAEIDEIQAKRDQVMTFLQSFVLDMRFSGRSREADVIRHLYINQTSKQETARAMHRSRQTIDVLEREALLSIASCLLHLRADGEYYNRDGFYFKRDKKTKELIKNLEECKSIDNIFENLSNCG